MKRAIVGNMFKTAARVCSGREERRESLHLAHTIANSNGYAPRGSHGARRSIQTREWRTDTSNTIQFCLPFSPMMLAEPHDCLRRAGLERLVTVTEIPPNNLKHQLVRNRLYDRLCTTPDCDICAFGKEGHL
ncbi:hypothetical protein Y032_0207g2050 [Ancylostoma ceylanicum]|uniref:Helix-turn-helix domain-containing protein n=1 Tax=Ancylostoma ceylanicum TaxID=53326 RepID=A0A016SLW9_9BILA|nr:hypothetical protein Y032_0207g2050 [Ancylostoma ceylanicum]